MIPRMILSMMNDVSLSNLFFPSLFSPLNLPILLFFFQSPQVWGGNYASYVKTRQDYEKNQMTRYKKEQDDMKHLLDFIRSCGTYANLRKQADSKQKIIDKMIEAGLTEKPVPDPQYQFR